MKVVATLALLCAFAAFVVAEECRDAGDCDHVTCPENDYTLECHFRQCTCTHSQRKCNAPQDCGTDDNCRSDWHCIDNMCRCGFGFGGFPSVGK